MNVVRPAVLVLAGSLIATLMDPAPLFADLPDPPVAPGARVRVEARGLFPVPTIGTVLSWEDDTFTMRCYPDSERVVAVPIASLLRMDRSRGMRGHGWAGAGIGLAVSVALGWIAISGNDSEIAPSLGFIVSVPVGGLLAGALVGGGVKTERWERVTLQPDR